MNYTKLIKELEVASDQLGQVDTFTLHKLHGIRVRIAKVIGTLEAWNDNNTTS